MALAFLSKMTLNPRERRLMTLLGGILAFLVVIVLPIGLQVLAYTRRVEVEELRTAISDVQSSRTKIKDRQSRRAKITARYAQKAPPLDGFLEEKARAEKLEVLDSAGKGEVPQGKKFVERHTVGHFKKAGMLAIAKFLESIEQSGFPVAVTRLNIRSRGAEPDSFDVEVGLSAYDRKDGATGGADKGDAP